MKNIYSLIISIFVINSSSIFSQSMFGENLSMNSIGVFSGYSLGIHKLNVSIDDGDCHCAKFDNKNQDAYNFGFTYERIIYYNSIIEISTSLSSYYEHFNYYNVQRGDDVSSLVEFSKEDQGYNPKDPNQNIHVSNLVYDLKLNYNIFGVESLNKIKLSNIPIRLVLGFQLANVESTNIRKDMKILTKYAQFITVPNYKYTDSGKTLLLDDGKLKESNIRVCLKTGIEFPVNLWMITINPGIYYTYSFKTISKNYDWYIDAVETNVEIFYNF